MSGAGTPKAWRHRRGRTVVPIETSEAKTLQPSEGAMRAAKLVLRRAEVEDFPIPYAEIIDRETSAERDRLRDALEDIAEPMKRIQAEAKATGYLVDGHMANQLCLDATWLRDKAKKALAEIGGKS